ncbi:unnamed protein product [Saimiriine gammaherpesvirus 2]|uniref:Uncharacterized gene 40 protein n=1 Tax=Saimiriine herpesvirus 2 (strain 11) TaxID=10383 RepID=VG40_SHV21|nr:unnamed protein product [Saimiriine gammaherpesvirus 2]Q01026.1 RecName: Full=Uncharacterized gene 40 protein [Herpesvirus saimiri (strain 11)]pir/B36810/ hypothetical protein ORF40 - saimiriine herpesvirus 1 (strain 11) [Saimiriine alphaherpesvirus 1]CAA45663.1 unnamed protein product [Saimiriine gammaherpesvirus 2]
MSIINSIDCHVIGIYFYNVILEKNLIIWQLNIITCSSHESTFCFVVDLLTAEDRDSILRVCSDQPTPQHHGVSLMTWELKLRMSQPILQTCMNNIRKPITILMSTDKVALEARPVLEKEACSGRYLKGAYLYSQCSQILASVPKLTLENNVQQWYPYLLNNSTIEDLEIHIKCSEGLYTCSSNSEPPLKKTQHLKIEDVFKIVDHSFLVAKTNIHIRTVIPIFHLLWVNVECKWNGCLPEFFRALHSKVYREFTGIAPIFTYLFPGGCPEATPFDIYFCGFPFVNLNCGKPEKILLCDLPRLHCPQILLSIPGNHADDLLCQPRDIPLPSIPKIWPINGIDINSKFCLEETSEIAFLNFKHIIVEVDFLCTICYIMGCKSDEIYNIMKFGSNNLNSTLQTWYNWFISTIFKWATQRSFNWTAMTQFKVYLSAVYASEIPKVSYKLVKDYE